MKRFGLALFLILGIVGISQARTGSNYATTPDDNGRDPDEYVAPAIYKATNTAAVTLSNQVQLSSGGATLIHTININTAGSVGAAFEIFNTMSSTSPATRLAKIDASAAKSMIFDLWCDSGTAFVNSGATPADVTVTYLDKR